MSAITLSNCTVSDAQAIAECNMTAWWHDPTYHMLWPGRTLQYVIDGAAARGPHRLLQGRERTRHVKAVDPATGRVVGYVRWDVPAGHEASWPEMRTPDVTDPAERARYRRLHRDADLVSREGMGVLDDPVHRIRPEILKGRTFLGESIDFHDYPYSVSIDFHDYSYSVLFFFFLFFS
jgi:hypothetical protein